MKRMKMESIDMVQKNIERIGELFPNVITEMEGDDGRLKKGINFELLKQELQDYVVDGEEHYEFTWVGKKSAIVESNMKTRKTLRPCIEESKDWETTQNLYIEGDNLEVLKLLQESYLNSIKMIYIDPPYNTGNDFIYRDNYRIDKNDYEDQIGLFDEEENRLFKNTETNGRFHSDWCSMMYPRLKLAYNLLSEDGVIFISIDDNEVVNLKNLCNEVFGESNFVGLFTIQSNPRGSQASKFLANVHEYICMFAKNINKLALKGFDKSEKNISEYSLTDEKGKKYRLLGLRQRGGAWKREDRPNMYYPIYVNPQNGNVSLEKDDSFCIEVLPKRPTGEESRWTWGKEKLLKDITLLRGKQINRSGEENTWDIFRMDYLETKDGEIKSTKVKTMWIEKEINYQNGRNDIKGLFSNSDIFDFPKPVYLLKQLIRMIEFRINDVILDFFSGSATTAHAVMQLNAEDGGNRKFIMVQLPEECDEKSEAYKAGYRNVSEIGKERIRRAGEKIKEDNKDMENIDKLDTGFRVLKVDSTNMKDVYYAANEYNQDMLAELESNIKEDRTNMDLLYGVLIDWGLPLSLNHRIEKIENITVHFYDCPIDDGELLTNNCSLAACFEEKIPENVVREIAKRQPLRAVFRDSSFVDSPGKINVEEIFRLLAPNTSVRVI